MVKQYPKAHSVLTLTSLVTKTAAAAARPMHALHDCWTVGLRHATLEDPASKQGSGTGMQSTSCRS